MMKASGREPYKVKCVQTEYDTLVLSELKCDANIRSNCIISSFGVLTILQMEILRTYRYLNNDEMTEREEKRACNALTIIRSLAVKQDIVIQFLECRKHVEGFNG